MEVKNIKAKLVLDLYDQHLSEEVSNSDYNNWGPKNTLEGTENMELLKSTKSMMPPEIKPEEKPSEDS